MTSRPSAVINSLWKKREKSGEIAKYFGSLFPNSKRRRSANKRGDKNSSFLIMLNAKRLRSVEIMKEFIFIGFLPK
ncbi:hypothetical protein [Acidianus sp. HS-5]|uniref:hypothetical protein n=1 Tax=Acidianus sp. HS-5 TaxID=2886040 RepID=UPI001F2A6272|nr:hypothetical protein [Acidianus sp. HS-5]